MIACIRVYQRWLSPLLGQNCRFYPSCSRYAIEALQIHGVLRGLCYACWRIVRCNPLTPGGVDPVPGSAPEEPGSSDTT
ncbi:MAG: membrane protein insertion efficiency factor YidD [Candidatus Hydrogenedentes bacterium]|nr:membrane protein insertion efficiency factor YidD [Candidatus Hydrogenedentota bacterium]